MNEKGEVQQAEGYVQEEIEGYNDGVGGGLR